MKTTPRALLMKRADLAHQQAALETQLRDIRKKLASVDECIRMFDADFSPPKNKKPRKPPKTRGWLGHGEVGTSSLSALREARGPLTAPQIVNQIAASRALTFKNRLEQEDFASSVAMALARYRRKGAVINVGERGRNGELRWDLAGR